jgi:hypothetical protein
MEGVLSSLGSLPSVKTWEVNGGHIRIIWDDGGESLHDVEAMVEAETMKVRKRRRDEGDHGDDDDDSDVIGEKALQGAIKAQGMTRDEALKQRGEKEANEEQEEWKKDLEELMNL